MKENFNHKNLAKVHFIGVGGVSMSALSRYLLSEKCSISGSDTCNSSYFLSVKEDGGAVYIGGNPSEVNDKDAVVFSSAIGEDNLELSEAIKQKIPLIKRSELLGYIMSDYKRSIAVAGSHGKTTATAMISCALIDAKLSPTVFCGGDTIRFGNFIKGEGEIVVAEACEYKKNFLDLKPKIAVVLNIDNDHLDSYIDMNDMIKSFEKFCSQGIAVINVDDENCKRISHSSTVSFGINSPACYTAEKIEKVGKGYSFVAKAYGRKLGKVTLKVWGRHNVYNALSCIAVCGELGIPFYKTAKSLEEFEGVRRRNEFIGEKKDCKIFADYAHHPKEINATVKTFLESDEPFFTVFQPHTYSRTRILMNDFIDVLLPIKDLVIYATYPAREKFDGDGDAYTLYKKLQLAGKKDVYFCQDKKALENKFLYFIDKYSLGLVLGAGDVFDIVKELL